MARAPGSIGVREAALHLFIAFVVAACGQGVSSNPFALSVEGLPLGTAGCDSDSECASAACELDRDGELRCCERDCQRELGRVCAESGACVCGAQFEETEDGCLLASGQVCASGEACASGFCSDGVCCEGSCDGLCERCNAAGECVLDADDEVCLERTGFECVAAGRCRLPLGLTCALDTDCELDQCELSTTEQNVCCDAACSSVCQRCGDDGTCDAFPPTDLRCPEVTCAEPTTCVRYQPPEPRACAANGDCAECTPVYTRRGTPCGIGEQCDGAGQCVFTGVGLVAAGGKHTCAVRATGSVRCWGSNVQGQLGAAFDRVNVGDDETPGSVADLEVRFLQRAVVQVAAGDDHTCVLLDDGGVRCWGRTDPSDYSDELRFESTLGTNDVGLDPSSRFVLPLNTGDVRLPGPAVQISAGWWAAHTCAVLASGDVSCWGANQAGQCGIGVATEEGVGGTNETLPIVDLGGRKALEVRVGRLHTCVLLEGGAVTCWGSSSAAMGYPGVLIKMRPDGDVDLGAPATALATAVTHTCAALEGGRVRCWGGNTRGQLGYGHTDVIGDDETPAAAATISHATSRSGLLGGDVRVGPGVVQIVPVMERATCARFANSVTCWGDNEKGQLGYGHTETLAPEYDVESLWRRPAFRPGTGAVTAGGIVDFDHDILALAENGRCATARAPGGGRGPLFCWGPNEHGELGIPCSPDASETMVPASIGPVQWEPSIGEDLPSGPPDAGGGNCPVPPPPIVVPPVVDTPDGGLPFVDPEPPSAECQRGELRCEGTLIARCNSETSEFELVRDCREVSLCARAAERCMRESCDPDELGCGLDELVPTAPGVHGVAVGRTFVCALIAGGAVRCWGNNADGQLGLGHEIALSSPEASGNVDIGGEAVQVVAGDSHVCVLLRTGDVRCWGEGGSGRLGNRSTTTIGDGELPSSVAPVELGGPAMQLSAGRAVTCALLEGGRVRCFGSGQYGMLGILTDAANQHIGDGEPPSSVDPVDLGGPTAFIASGDDHTCAISRTGKLRCWGRAMGGRLGHGGGHAPGLYSPDVGDDETPAQAGVISLGGRVIHVAPGFAHTCAVLSGGAVRCWGGNNLDLELGQPSGADAEDRLPMDLLPLALGGRALQVAAASDHTCALLETGRVLCFGGNRRGELGLASDESKIPLERARDVDLPDAALLIDAADNTTCAVLGTRALSCWGGGAEGQLGYGNNEDVGDDETPGTVGPVSVF